MLLRLGGCRQRTPPGAAPIEADVSQEDFAAMTNLARTTAGTVLRTLAAAGRIDVSYRKVRILKPDALRAMLEARPKRLQGGFPRCSNGGNGSI